MTPYVITTTRPDDISGLELHELPEYPTHHVSRRAVATLEEARGAAGEAVTRACGTEHDDYEFQGDAHSLPESGGTVGPLPDGTVIEVERVKNAKADRSRHDCP